MQYFRRFAQRMAIKYPKGCLDPLMEIAIDGITLKIGFKEVQNEVVRVLVYLGGAEYPRRRIAISCRNGNIDSEYVGEFPNSDLLSNKIEIAFTKMTCKEIIRAIISQYDLSELPYR